MPSDRALALATQWNTEAAAIVGGETVPTGHRHTESDIDNLTTALAARVANSRIGAANGVAPLDATAKVPVANLPDISTTRGVFPVASQAAMLALNAQVGAVAVRSDLAGQSYILAALPASNLSNWLTQSPPGTVTSVNGQTGAVTVPLPALATTTTDGLMPAGDRLILSATGATANQTLRYNGTVIVWAAPTIWTVRTSNTTLAANENCMASTGVTQLTLPSTVAGCHEIANNTTAYIGLYRGGTATLSGVFDGVAFFALTWIRVAPGARAVFVANGSDWVVSGGDLTQIELLASNLELALPLSLATGLVDQSPSIRTANGATAGTAKTVTAVGSAAPSTAQSKYYGSSLFLNGSTQHLTISGHAVPGTGDFCVEGWYYLPSSKADAYLIDLGSSDSLSPVLIFTSTTLDLYVNGAYRISAPRSVGVWQHFALWRLSGVWRLAVDGVIAGTYSWSGNLTSSSFFIGNYVAPVSAYAFNGSLQDIRYYRGVAKYGTANFTPPGRIV